MSKTQPASKKVTLLDRGTKLHWVTIRISLALTISRAMCKISRSFLPLMLKIYKMRANCAKRIKREFKQGQFGTSKFKVVTN